MREERFGGLGGFAPPRRATPLPRDQMTRLVESGLVLVGWLDFFTYVVVLVRREHLFALIAPGGGTLGFFFGAVVVGVGVGFVFGRLPCTASQAGEGKF